MNEYMKLTENHNEILLYIAYKEGLMSKTDYINYLKSQMMEIVGMESEDKALEQDKQEQDYICDTCKHNDKEWDEEPCDGCCGNHSGYEQDKPKNNVLEQLKNLIDEFDMRDKPFDEMSGFECKVLELFKQNKPKNTLDDLWKNIRKWEKEAEQDEAKQDKDYHEEAWWQNLGYDIEQLADDWGCTIECIAERANQLWEQIKEKAND